MQQAGPHSHVHLLHRYMVYAGPRETQLIATDVEVTAGSTTSKDKPRFAKGLLVPPTGSKWCTSASILSSTSRILLCYSCSTSYSASHGFGLTLQVLQPLVAPQAFLKHHTCKRGNPFILHSTGKNLCTIAGTTVLTLLQQLRKSWMKMIPILAPKAGSRCCESESKLRSR